MSVSPSLSLSNLVDLGVYLSVLEELSVIIPEMLCVAPRMYQVSVYLIIRTASVLKTMILCAVVMAKHTLMIVERSQEVLL
jgi:hypothetical protein